MDPRKFIFVRSPKCIFKCLSLRVPLCACTWTYKYTWINTIDYIITNTITQTMFKKMTRVMVCVYVFIFFFVFKCLYLCFWMRSFVHVWFSIKMYFHKLINISVEIYEHTVIILLAHLKHAIPLHIIKRANSRTCKNKVE